MNKLKVPSSIAPDEILARYIFSSRFIRKSDGSVKPDAFIPHPYLDLSVTRTINLSEEQIWAIGKNIESNRSTNATLHGRADTTAQIFTDQNLNINPDPTKDNPNHAIVAGWPKDKPAQKMLALEVSQNAKFLRY